MLDRMPGSKAPVIRQPFVPGDLLLFWSMGVPPGSWLFDLANDPGEDRNLAGVEARAERDAAEALRAERLRVEAPADPLERLGLA